VHMIRLLVAGCLPVIMQSISPGTSSRIGEAFAALTHERGVVVWGHPSYGGLLPSDVSHQLVDGIRAVYSTSYSFAALKDDGSVVTWGTFMHPNVQARTPSLLGTGTQTIRASRHAFAALQSDGSVVAWGSPAFGGDATIPANALTNLSNGVQEVFSNSWSFAALKLGGAVVTWGSAQFGGSVTSDEADLSAQLSRGVNMIYSTSRAFAALMENGRVVAWGSSKHGGSMVHPSNVLSQLTAGVRKIFSTCCAFAALKGDGSVVVWGSQKYGGMSPSFAAVSGDLTAGVQVIYSTSHAFAALKDDGSVVTWGWPLGSSSAAAVRSQLMGDVQAIYSNDGAFAALRYNGSVVTWGDSRYGGSMTIEARRLAHHAPIHVAHPDVSRELMGGVRSIHSTESAFAALKDNGAVVAWGDARGGGLTVGLTWGGIHNATSMLSRKVLSIHSTACVFTALRSDGVIVTWGDGEEDKDPWRYVHHPTTSRIVAIFGQTVTSSLSIPVYSLASPSAGKVAAKASHSVVIGRGEVSDKLWFIVAVGVNLAFFACLCLWTWCSCFSGVVKRRWEELPSKEDVPSPMTIGVTPDAQNMAIS